MIHKGKQRVVYTLILRIISKFSTYFLLLILGNFLLLETYGKFSFAFAIFNIVSILCMIGVPTVFTPYLVKKKDTSSVFYFLLIITLLFSVAGLIISFSVFWILPLAVSLPFLVFRNVGFSILNSRYKYNVGQFASTLAAILTPILVYNLIRFNELGIALGYSIGYVVSSLLILIIVRKPLLGIIKRVKLNGGAIAGYLKKSSVVSLIVVSFSFLNWIDSFILGILSTFENVAKYNIASPLSNVIALIPFALGLFLLTRSAELDRKELKKFSLPVLQRTLRISFFFSLILAVFLNSLIFLIVKVFFKKYIGIEAFFMILSIGILFFSLYGLIYIYFAGKLQPEKALLPLAMAAIVNIVLDIILIPFFGLYGIVFATLIAHFAAFVLLLNKVKLLKNYSLAILFVLFVPVSFYLQYYGILLLILVIPSMFILRLINKEDIISILKPFKL